MADSTCSTACSSGTAFAGSTTRPGKGRYRRRPGRRGDESGVCVYFIKCDLTGLVKIGTSAMVAQRLSQLQVGSPTPLRLIGYALGSLEEEYAIHDRHRARWSHGEWFRMTDEETAAELGALVRRNGTPQTAIAEKVRLAREAWK